MRALVIAVASLWVCASPGLASAEPVDARVERGLSEFQDLEFAAAIQTLEGILRVAEATPGQRILALELIAISHLTLGRVAEAKEAFTRLLRIQPNYELRNHDGSPKVESVFEDARRELARLVRETQLSLAPMGTIGSGQRIRFVVSTQGSEPKAMRLFWKAAGERTYKSAAMRRSRANRWRVGIELPERSSEHRVLYYVEAMDLAGSVVASLGKKEEPAFLSVPASRRKKSGKAWYKRWPVWAGLGVALGAGTAVVLSSGSSLREGSLSPGRITLSP